MLIEFYIADKDRERDLAINFRTGARANGDRCHIRAAPKFAIDPRVDAICVFALKGASRDILERARAAGVRTILFDKGILRAATGLGGPQGYYRVSLDEFMPLGRIERMMLEPVRLERWRALRMEMRTRWVDRPDTAVIFCGSSQKYCDFHDLGDEHDYAQGVIDEIRRYTDRPIIYRPKPSYLIARPIAGTTFSRPPEVLGRMLPNAHALVTHGSHAAVDAITGGVPAITLGPSAARPVANLELAELARKLTFPDGERQLRWISTLTWWQWSSAEIASGQMWAWLRDEMDRPAAAPGAPVEFGKPFPGGAVAAGSVPAPARPPGGPV